jgi:hypothetical protein
VAVAGLVAGLLVFLSGDDASGSEVLLEPVATTTRDPFADSISIDEKAWRKGAEAMTSTTSGTADTFGGGDGEVVTTGTAGDEPGLYGGTRDKAACDGDKLVAFLADNPDKAEAWAGVLGIAPDAIAGYVADLTPVVLTTDTRVTNHGFRDGKATSLQSVLEAGTAVLVDPYGTPRVKCGCGNPLLPPEPVNGVAYTGDAWPGFEPAEVIHVVAGAEQEVLVLAEASGGSPFARPVGSAGEADGVVLYEDFSGDTAGWLLSDDGAANCVPTSSDASQEVADGRLAQALVGGRTDGRDCAWLAAERIFPLPEDYDGGSLVLRAGYRVPEWSDQVEDGFGGKEGWADLVLTALGPEGEPLGAARYRVSCDDRHGEGRLSCAGPDGTAGDGSTMVLVHDRGTVGDWATIEAVPTEDLDVDWSAAAGVAVRYELLGAFMHDDAWRVEWDGFTIAVPGTASGATDGGQGDGAACPGTGDGATLPASALLVHEAAGDLDGDGRADRVIAYLLEEEGAAAWHLRLVTAKGFGSDLALAVTVDPVASVRPLGASDVGGGAETAFVQVGVGASSQTIGLFALVDCELLWVENAAGAGPPTEFPVGGTVTSGLGLECRDADGDGDGDLVVRTATSTDGRDYATQEIALGRVGGRLDGAATGGWTDLGSLAGDASGLAGFYGLACQGVELGGGDGNGGEAALCGSAEEVVGRLVAARAADDRAMATPCAFDTVVDYVFTLSAERVAAAGEPVCQPAADAGLSGFSDNAEACTVPSLGILVIERAPDAAAVVATRVVVFTPEP